MPFRFLPMFIALATIIPLAVADVAVGQTSDPCAVDHPFMPPSKQFSGMCPNCGMLRSMWARTWKTFELAEGKSEACSLHCLGDIAAKSEEGPKHVMVAVWSRPEEMIPAEKAVFVIGSKAKGTMTMTSKVACASEQEAQEYAKSCGGTISTFAEAFKIAKEALPAENTMIAKMRIEKGVIVEPTDNKETCAVCNMFPARYPNNRCQVVTTDKERHHFCSVQCLFTFLHDPRSYANKDLSPQAIWLADYPSGAWVSARTAYFVVGSSVQGPMGPEAFAFAKKSDAQSFSKEEGGLVIGFRDLSIEKIKPKE